ncbi:hypothetical protein IMSHALPRED_002658 [Imshaugia aleurites]|uniref:Uncharacterized protein n=1 Tax=Imshaugia aleurites TaxID=172621 RepID=A0A8H3EZT7_9LECA|nr:hypothetical protein IMSHALPRED_002658 [Imshaugia aleurites]
MAAGAGYGIAEDVLPNPFRTTGVENIEKRYSSGGGAKNHLPGAATKRGDHESVEGNTETAKGIGSPHHEAHVQGQKPDQPSGFDKTWNRAQYNSEKGK